MGILLCKPGDGVWALTNREHRPACLPCPFAWPCAPCASPSCVAFCCQQSRECLCVKRQGWRTLNRMPCVPGISAMRFSACGRYLYQLSGEADCIHVRSTSTGELLYAAPAGVFPHCMKEDPSGKMILAAGGAVNEAFLFNAPDLTVARVITTRHPCFAADFWREGLALVCAAEGDDIRTVVYTLAHRAARPRKVLELSGPPCAACVCPDGLTALVSTRCGLTRFDLRTGDLLWNRPEWAMCLRVECEENRVLVSDTLDGGVCLLHLHKPWSQRILTTHRDSQACFL